MTHEEATAACRDSLVSGDYCRRHRAASPERCGQLEQALSSAVDLLTASRMFPVATADLRKVLKGETS